MLIGLFECSENLSQWRRNPRSEKQSQRRRNWLGRKSAKAWALETIFKFIIGIQDDDVDLSREGRVPRFWADDRSGGFFVADFIVLLVGVCFEAIHLPGFFHFRLTRSCRSGESRASLSLLSPFISLWNTFWVCTWEGWWTLGNSHNCYFFGALSGSIPYILAWTVTFVLAFASVRDLPPGAYETVHWTTFIPHI